MKQRELQEVQKVEQCRKYLKENVCFCLVNKEEKIDESYCNSYLDLDIIYYLMAKDGELIVLSKKIIEQLNIDVQDLEKWAKDNCKKKYPICIMKMDADKMFNYHIKEVEKIEEDSKPSFYIMQMDGAIYGSNVLAYPEIFEKFGEALGKNYYIIPTSKHELFIVVENDGFLTDENVKECHSVLQDQIVNKEDFLSKSVYYYERETGKINII